MSNHCIINLTIPNSPCRPFLLFFFLYEEILQYNYHFKILMLANRLFSSLSFQHIGTYWKLYGSMAVCLYRRVVARQVVSAGPFTVRVQHSFSRYKSARNGPTQVAGLVLKLVCPPSAYPVFHASTNFSSLFLGNHFETKYLNTAIKFCDYFLLAAAAVATQDLLDPFGTGRGVHL